MATILTNRAFPDSRADLSRAAAQGNVIGFVAPGSIVNQQWEFPPVGAPPSFVNVKNAAAGGVLVGAAAADVAVGGRDFQAVISGGGPENKFVIEIVSGGIRICLPGTGGRPALYWTLVNNLRSTPIRLMVLRDDVEADTQIWDLDHVA